MNDYPREATGRELSAWRKELIEEFRALAKAKIDDAAFATEITRLDAKMDAFNRIRLLPTPIDIPAGMETEPYDWSSLSIVDGYVCKRGTEK